MKLELSKCTFGCRSVKVLGHSGTPGGILASGGHIESDKNLCEPEDGAELSRFLGLADYFAEFIEDIANRSKALCDVLAGSGFNKRTPKGTKMSVPELDRKWNKEQYEAWEDLKDDPDDPQILVAPRRALSRKLMTDACSYGLGAVLL